MKLLIKYQKYFKSPTKHMYPNSAIDEPEKVDICSSDILVNKNRITFKEIMRNPKYREILFGDE